MKKKIIILFLLPVILVAATCNAAEYNYWSDFLPKAHRYTYQGKDRLLKRLEYMKNKFGISLEDHNRTLLAEVTGTTGDQAPLELDQSDIITDLSSNKYMNAAIGQYLEYIASSRIKNLKNAALLIKQLKPSFEINKTYHYWNYIIEASSSLAGKNPEKFKDVMYSLWQDIIIPIKLNKDNGLASPGTFSAELDHICANALYLITEKSIIEYRNSHMDTLGSMAVNLSNMLPEDEKYYRTMMRFYEGRNSDSSNLNFSVAYVHGLVQANMLDNARSATEYENTFKRAINLFDLAYHWAGTDKGKAAVLMRKAQPISKTWAYIYDGSNLTNRAYFKTDLLPLSQRNLEDCEKVFKRLACPLGQRAEAIKSNGFKDNKKDYSLTLRSLWSTYIMLMQWQTSCLYKSGDYDLKKRAKKNFADQIIFSEEYFNNPKYADLIPAEAFFSTSSCASRLAFYFADKAKDKNTPGLIKQALYFQAYSSRLNPLAINDLVLFANIYQLDLEQGVAFINLFKPLSDVVAASIRSSESGDGYLKYKDCLGYLASEVGSLYSSLPKIVEYVTGAGDNICRNAIIFSNLYEAIIADYGPIRTRKELGEFYKKDGLKNPRQALRDILSNDIYNSISQSITRGRKLNPYNYYRMNVEMQEVPESPLHLFLKKLYYNTEKEMEKTFGSDLKRIDRYVVESCSSLNAS